MTDTAASPSAVPGSVTDPAPGPDGGARPPVKDVLSTTAGRPRFGDARRAARRRVVRRIEPMSVLKVSVLFYACVLVVLVVAGILLWLVASAAGVVGNAETFIGDLFALDEFHFEALQILGAAFVGGAVLVLVGTALNVLAVTLFNLVADLVGGFELTIVDDDDGPVPGAGTVV